jgi:hypothetical protein
MAKRKQLFHPDDVKAKIQASQLINRLQRHALGEIEMTTTQIASAKILLDKSVPNLSSSEIKSETTVRYVARIPNKATTSEEWQQEHQAPQTPTLQ